MPFLWIIFVLLWHSHFTGKLTVFQWLHPGLHNGMHYCSPPSEYTVRNQRREKNKNIPVLQTVPFSLLQLYFYWKVTISSHKHCREHCEMHYSTKHKRNGEEEKKKKNTPIWINSKYFYYSRCVQAVRPGNVNFKMLHLCLKRATACAYFARICCKIQDIFIIMLILFFLFFY